MTKSGRENALYRVAAFVAPVCAFEKGSVPTENCHVSVVRAHLCRNDVKPGIFQLFTAALQRRLAHSAQSSVKF